MSGVLYEAKEEAQPYKIWKRKIPSSSRGLLQSEASKKINMSNLYPPSEGTNSKSCLSGRCEGEMSIKQETTFTDDYSTSVPIPHNTDEDALWVRKNGLGDTKSTMNQLPKPIHDSQGAEHPCNLFTQPESSITQPAQPRMRSPSVDSDAASSASTTSNYVSDNGSIIELASTANKGRSWSSSSSTGVSSSGSGQQAWSMPNEPFVVNGNTDSAIDIEEDDSMDALLNESQPLLLHAHEYETDTCNQMRKSSLPPLHQTNVHISNETDGFQPNVTLIPLQIGKENQDPTFESVLSSTASDEKPYRNHQIPLSEKSSANETIYNLQSVLSHCKPLSQKANLTEKEGPSAPVLQVLVPVCNAKTSKSNPNSVGKKNTNVFKRRQPASNPLTCSHPDSISVTSHSVHSSEAGPATIHYRPRSEPSQTLPTVPQLTCSSPQPVGFSPQEKNNFVYESYVQSPRQGQNSQGNIPQIQPASAFAESKEKHNPIKEATRSGSVYSKPTTESLSNLMIQPENYTLPYTYDPKGDPQINGHNRMGSNLLSDTKHAGVNLPKLYRVSNAHFYVPTMPNTPTTFLPTSQYNDFVANGQIQEANSFTTPVPQINSNPEQSQTQRETRGRPDAQHPFVTLMDPYRFPNVYQCSYEPRPLAVPMYYSGIPRADHPSLGNDMHSSVIYHLHQPLPSLPLWLSTNAPQPQHFTTPASDAANKPPSSPPMYASSIPIKRLECQHEIKTVQGQNSYPDKYFPTTTKFPAHTSSAKQANSQASSHAPVTNNGHEVLNLNSPRARDLNFVGMQNHHNATVSNNRLVVSNTFETGPTRYDGEGIVSLPDPSRSYVEEISEQQSGPQRFVSLPEPNRSYVEEISGQHSGPPRFVSLPDPSRDYVEEMSGQQSGPQLSSNQTELSEIRCDVARGLETNTVVNAEEGPVQAVVADRKNSLPSSINSGTRESNSLNSQLPILKDDTDFLRLHPSKCYQGLCIISSIANPIIGLVSLFLLYLASKDFKRQRYMRSSHLQLAAIILSTCGIFISLNIFFLLCVPWAVKVHSPQETVSLEAAGGGGEVPVKRPNRIEQCIKTYSKGHFLEEYGFDAVSFCTVVWNKKLKNALNVHLWKDRDKERKWQKEINALEAKINSNQAISDVFGDDDWGTTLSNEANRTEESQIETVAVPNTTSLKSETSAGPSPKYEARKQEAGTTHSGPSLPLSTDVPPLLQTPPQDVKVGNNSHSLKNNIGSSENN